MDFTTIGSINTYTKTLKMQTKWNLKKQSGDVTSHPMTERDIFQSQINEARERGDSKLKTIAAKVDAGSKLTTDERRYLQAKDPEAYQELVAREREQKAYEQALKKCKTKEEVQRLKASALGASMTKLKAVENDPNIGIEKKLKIFKNEQLKLQKFAESEAAFVKSGEYAALPTEAEKVKAEKELHEAEQAQRNPETEQTEQRPDSSKAEQTPEQAEESVRPEAEEKMTESPAVKQEVKPGIAEPESPEVQKVRRAKAKAKTAYKPASMPDETVATLNVQA